MSPEPGDEVAVDGVAALLEARIGLRSEPTVRSRLRRSVRDEAATLGLDLTDYQRTVATDADAFESLLDRLTVQESGFFRHPEQFAVLADAVLPGIPPPVRIWSAGCANGQEPYSLAMLLQERGIDGSVVATDLSPAALDRTAAGRYAAREIGGLSPERVARHLSPAGAGWEVSPSLRERVTPMRHNLVDPLPAEVLSCRVVFCRNVLIYLAPDRIRAFLGSVATEIAPVALFLGSAESIWPLTDLFEAVRVDGAFVHRPRRPPQPVARRPARTDGTAPGPGRGDPARSPAGRTAGRTPAAGLGAGPPAGARTGPRADPRAGPRAGPRTEPGGGQADAGTAGELARAGQRALAAGDAGAAVVSFRKWAYIAPDDVLAQLSLGFALDAAGDRPAALRAYDVARRLVRTGDPADIERVTEGYTRQELLRMLDGKRRGVAS